MELPIPRRLDASVDRHEQSEVRQKVFILNSCRSELRPTKDKCSTDIVGRHEQSEVRQKVFILNSCRSTGY